MLLTYRFGQQALAAVSDSDLRQIGGQTLVVSLLTCEWRQQIEEELNLTPADVTEDTSVTRNSLLGEDFSIPSMSFDMDG